MLRPANSPANSRTGSRACIDPRTKLLMLVVLNALAMTARSTQVLWVVIALVALLLLFDATTTLFPIFCAFLVGAAAALYAPHLATNWITAMLGMLGFWLLRFGVCLAMAAWLLTTTKISHLIEAFHALRLPQCVIIPLSVVFRFIPVVVEELRGIREAMALRGHSGRALWLHPIRTAEHIIVPLLSASIRTADELSAAALIRGLGSPGRPTRVANLRFRLIDALLITVVVAVTAYAWCGGVPA